MEIETIIANNPVIEFDDKQNLLVTLQLQTTISIEEFETLLTMIKEQKDGTFKTTLTKR